MTTATRNAANAATSQDRFQPAVDQQLTQPATSIYQPPHPNAHLAPIQHPPTQTVHLPPRPQPTQLPRVAATYPTCDHPCLKSSEEIYPQPVWKFLPWPQPLPHLRQVKRLLPTPDISIKGSLIDIFV